MEDKYNIMDDDKREEKSEETLVKKRNNRAYVVFLSIYVIVVFIIIYGSYKYQNMVFINKEELKQNIISSIENNADLEIVKDIFYDKRYEKSDYVTNLKYRFYLSNLYYEKKDLTLDVLLKEIRNDLYINNTSKDSNKDYFSKRLELLMQENREKNPFDLLSDIQKEYFENLRIKLKNKNTYDDVKNDVENIVSELNEKNRLVNDYLDKSNISYYLSIVALILAIFPIFSQTINLLRKISNWFF